MADIAVVPTPNQVLREDGSRRIDVTCSVSGRDLGKLARAIEERMAGVEFERGYRAELLGEYAAREAAQRLMRVFALIGGVLGAWLSGGVLSLGSMIGFVTVFGIAARNAILLVSHYRHLELEEGLTFGRELIVRGAQERLAPILMTALTAGLGLLPLVLAGNEPGAEIEFRWPSSSSVDSAPRRS